MEECLDVSCCLESPGQSVPVGVLRFATLPVADHAVMGEVSEVRSDSAAVRPLQQKVLVGSQSRSRAVSRQR